MITTRNRFVRSNEPVLSQLDFLQNDGFSRQAGLGLGDVSFSIFFQNQLQPWSAIIGTNIQDQQVAAGALYFNEIPGSPGYYNARFRPNAIGYWRLVAAYTAGTQLIVIDFDVSSLLPAPGPGLVASFVRPR